MPGQLLPVEEHHEVGQVALVVAVAADLAHEVHAHHIATQSEEQAVAQAQDAGVAPDQVHGERADGVVISVCLYRPQSAVRPLTAKMPCGRFWMKMMMKTSTAILASTAPVQPSRNLLSTPRPSAAYTVPASWPTPPSTTTMNESTM